MDHPTGTLSQRLANGLYSGLIDGMLRLPYARRVPAMGRLMRQAVAPLAGYRRRARDHLAWIYPDRPGDWHRTVADAASDNAGRTLIELYSGSEFTAHAAQQPLGGAGLDAIHDARAAGQPVLFLTGHFGNHEAVRHALVSQGFQIGGLYRPMRNPYFNARYAATMTALSGPVVPQGRKGTTAFLRHLKGGGMMTLLFDVWVGAGTPLPFLGHPAPTSLAAAEFALRTGALLVPYWGIRKPDGLGFDLHIETPIPHTTAPQMMQEATLRLESRIAETPEQWFWTHRRWKPERAR